MSRRLTDLQEEYNFSELVIVAHSMGGLVSRDVINNLVELESPIQIPLFLTLSTPWEGHEAAELGVKYSPVIVPCWIDMVPGSDFLTKLWETPLPDETEHALFFSYHGKNSSIIDRNNDGIVTVSSQLSLEPQKNAVMVRGFNVNHTGILKDPQVIDCFKTLVSEKLNNFHQ